MTDKPASAARGKSRNSMAVGMDLLKQGEADAFVTAGNTGGAMANALFRLGRIRGVKRPALCGIFPVRDGHAVVLDIGANTDCKPEYLLQFAILGSFYAETVLGKPSPRVALHLQRRGSRQGQPAGQGHLTPCCRQRAQLRRQRRAQGTLRRPGGRRRHATASPAMSCSRASEAVASFLTSIIREQIKASPVTAVGGLLARPAFDRVGR